ncbi:hypothetical protein [Williamsia sp. CHRR-6]|uniref:hypothetical protein n=1 Tax=Williamsia sp. CHRR-6 TaxID=2835871 RepID=UPI001BDAF239|nr:hypothetical protein [Williamsia sp. CHRR-6]MBT0568564.1 hypothetical protein [Williamsia sp. CHRR-6]
MATDLLDTPPVGLVAALGIDIDRDLAVPDQIWANAIAAMLGENEAAERGPRRKP